MNIKSIINMASACLLNVTMATQVSATPINIDFGSVDSSTPSTYGGAGQAGQWNFITGLGLTGNLIDINGNQTGANLDLLASIFGNDCSGVSTVDKALLCDNFYSNVNLPISLSTWDITLSGLDNGLYSLVLYAPTNSLVSTGLMTVNNIATAELVGTGSNLLIEGVSYSILHTQVTDGGLSIAGSLSGSNFRFAGLSGMQISQIQTSVPEPATAWLICLGLIGFIIFVRRKALY